MYVYLTLDVDAEDEAGVEEAVDAINLPGNVEVVLVDYGIEDDSAGLADSPLAN